MPWAGAGVVGASVAAVPATTVPRPVRDHFLRRPAPAAGPAYPWGPGYPAV
jgi:hypothetical protein